MNEGSWPARFQDVRPVGEGSQGTVWRAFDTALGREVALKTARSADPLQLALLKGEFRLLQELQHPGIVVPLEVLAEGDTVWVVLPFVDGEALDQWAGAVGHEPAAIRWARLRPTIVSLIDAVAALHEAGMCHGDLKPSNVLVDAHGAPHLLDFGLANDTRRPAGPQPIWGGTFAYQAPEILAGDLPSPAGDLYALGVLLAETTLGRRPDPFSTAPWRPEPDDPEELTGLLDGLLPRAPADRQTASESLARLGGKTVVSPIPFVGRTAELTRLCAAAQQAIHAPAPQVVRLQGASGIGKSGLLREFAGQLEDDWSVLWGRAHALDHVPYNALDEILQQLALSIPPGHTPGADVGAVFAAFRATATEGTAAAQPDARRRNAFRGIVELVSAITRLRRLALVVDDVQWADGPSSELLAAIVDQAPGPLLVVVAHRPSDTPPMVQRMETWATSGRLALSLDIGPLRPDDATELWRALGGGAQAPDGPDAGHPLFLRTLAAPHASGENDIEQITASRFATLDAEAQRVLAMVALAGEPLTRQELRTAAALAADGRIIDLTRARWLSLVGVGGERVESAHDRIGAVIRGRAAEPSRLHGALYEARRHTAAPASLWRHAHEAGLTAAAAGHAWEAAERAEAALAFEQAIAWFERCEQGGGAGHTEATVHERLAAALVYAGRGAQAVNRYRRAAAAVPDDGSAQARREQLRLSVAAADYEVRTGHAQEGINAFAHLLGQIGEVMPTEDRFASREATLRRIKSLVFGWKPERVADLPADQVVDLEVVRKAMTAFSGVAPQLTDCLGLRALDQSRKTGCRRNLVLSLGTEASIEAMVGGWPLDRRADEMLSWIQDNAGAEPYLRAFVTQCTNVVAFARGRFQDSALAGTSAVTQLRQRCPGTEWEVSLILSYTHHSQWWLGDLHALRDDVERALEDAERRGDAFAANTHRLGEPALALLVDDQHDRVLERANTAEACWPDLPFHVYRYLHALTVTGVHLYRGEPEDAWRRLDAAWPNLVRGNLLLLGVLAMHLWSARARAAIATGRVSEARQAIRGLRKLKRLPQASPLANLMQGCLEDAPPLIERAAGGLEDLGAPLWAAAARWRAGRGVDAFAAHRVAAPERFAAMLTPRPPTPVARRGWW